MLLLNGEPSLFAEIQIEADIKSVMKYLRRVQSNYGSPCEFVCAYDRMHWLFSLSRTDNRECRMCDYGTHDYAQASKSGKEEK